jgi:hypothetical protein
VGLAVPDVLTEYSDNFGIGLGVEVVTPLDEDVLELLVYLVSRDQAGRVRYSQLVMIPSIASALSSLRVTRPALTVDKTELGPGVADVRVTVERVGNTVGSPSSVSHRSLAEENLLHVDLGNASVLIVAHLSRKRGRKGFSNVFA